MNEGYYNTYTISDSDISIIADDSPINETPCKDNDCLSASDEPEFFQQVIQRVRFEFNEFCTKIAYVKLLLMCFFLAKTKKIVISKNSYSSKRPCTGSCPD